MWLGREPGSLHHLLLWICPLVRFSTVWWARANVSAFCWLNEHKLKKNKIIFLDEISQEWACRFMLGSQPLESLPSSRSFFSITFTTERCVSVQLGFVERHNRHERERERDSSTFTHPSVHSGRAAASAAFDYVTDTWAGSTSESAPRLSAKHTEDQAPLSR